MEAGSIVNMSIYPNDILIIANSSLTACHKDIMIAPINDGFIAKQFTG